MESNGTSSSFKLYSKIDPVQVDTKYIFLLSKVKVLRYQSLRQKTLNKNAISRSWRKHFSKTSFQIY